MSMGFGTKPEAPMSAKERKHLKALKEAGFTNKQIEKIREGRAGGLKPQVTEPGRRGQTGVRGGKVITFGGGELTDKEKKSLVTAGRIEGVLKPGVYEDLLSKDSKILLSDARETVSVLGKLIRDKFEGKAAGEAVDTGKLLKLQGSFLEQMNKDAGSAYMNQLQNFNSLVKTNKELLNNDIISKLTKIEIGNKLKIADEDIFLTTFKRGLGSGKTAQEVFDVIKNSPDAMAAYKNSIFDFYK